MTTIFVQIAAELLTTFLLERYCIMKCIKYVITALLALFCFIMSTISLKMPEYLGSGGFVSIAKTSGYSISLDDDGNTLEASEMYITLYIWPKFFSGYKIGLDFYDEANSIWEQVELTPNMEMMNTDALDDAYIDYILQLISEHQDEINELIGIAGKNIDINITQV